MLNMSLAGMGTYLQSFRAAVALFDFAAPIATPLESPTGFPPHDVVIRWPYIAARDGAMNIYHFRVAMEAAKASAHQLQLVRDAINWTKVRAATKRFQTQFPDFEKIRHAVAHAADLGKTLKEQRRNRIKGPRTGPLVRLSAGASVTIANSLINQTFATTIGGQLVSYDVTTETADKLEAIMLEFYSLFRTS